MKVEYSHDDDVLMIHLSKEKIDYAEEDDGMIVHFSRKGHPVLLEILDASQYIARHTRVTAA